ncbi:MAG: hypothetical protein HKM01_00500 [Gallionella sp.]|jgi:hypothetical protein|nr:hypothetical protein [Gallionella sp.]NNM78931.1 hypothetical protein [Gallionella sp.]
MIAIEIEAPIIDHRINVMSDQLPSQSRMAKIIVMFEKEDADVPTSGVLAHLRANPAQAREDGLPMKREELYDRTGTR